MKALSIKQPYADLILKGEKKIELRKWSTKFRGEFLVHACKRADLNECKIRNIDPKKLVTGAILGKVTLVDVKKYESVKEIMEDKKDFSVLSEVEKWFVIPTYGFMLKDPVKFDKPIFHKGQLSFWSFDGLIK